MKARRKERLEAWGLIIKEGVCLGRGFYIFLFISLHHMFPIIQHKNIFSFYSQPQYVNVFIMESSQVNLELHLKVAPNKSRNMKP